MGSVFKKSSARWFASQWNRAPLLTIKNHFQRLPSGANLVKVAHYLSSPTTLVLLAAAIAAACARAQQTTGALPPQPPRSAPVAASVGTASSPKVPAATWP